MSGRKGKVPIDSAFRIKLRGEDGASLSISEVQHGLLEAARQLATYEAYRAKWVTVYLTLIDEDGKPVLPERSGEWTLHPYKCAADEFGL